jgi:uncharacterized protein (TIGR00369 family)
LTRTHPLLPRIGGFSGELGLRFTAWSHDEVEMSLTLEPRHLNRNGTAHGGVIMTLLDTTCSAVGCRLVHGEIHGRVVVVSLTTNFIAPAREGTIRARARKTGGGRRMFMMQGEAFDEAGARIATASGVGRVIADKEA